MTRCRQIEQSVCQREILKIKMSKMPNIIIKIPYCADQRAFAFSEISYATPNRCTLVEQIVFDSGHVRT